jgi:carbon storage regulator
MLVISRKPGEKLRIGDNVEVTVLEISGSRVVLGIDAPREIAIRRVGSASIPSEEAASTTPLPDFTPPTVEEDVHLTKVPKRSCPLSIRHALCLSPSERRVKTPVVTVRRSRKITLPVDGEVG